MRKNTYEKIILFVALICVSTSLALHMQRPKPRLYEGINVKDTIENVSNKVVHNMSEEIEVVNQKIEEKRIEEEETVRKAAEEDAARQTAAEQEVQSYSYSNGSGLTMSSGVNYHNGRTETYYSSQVAYHYRTPEWWVDGEGFYRTSEGYYVVACSDMAQGAVFQGSKGMCQVLDSGCAAGVTDYYVTW